MAFICARIGYFGVLYVRKDLFFGRWRQMVEDKLLIWRFKRGHDDALRRIYKKYKNDLLKLAVVLVNDVAAAEDVVQDVFLKFAQSASQVGISGNLRRYLLTCIANRARNLKRNRHRHRAGSLDDEECVVCDSRRPEQWAILSEELQRLSDAMAQIPADQREIIALYMQGGVSFRQIAKVYGVPLSTIRGRYGCGLNKLRIILNSEVIQ